MKRWLYLICILCLTTITTSDIVGQRGRSEPVFGLTAVAGVNLTQIDGDNFTGYNKVGFQGGLRGIVNISPKFEGRVELLFAQKGSRFPSAQGFREGEKDRLIALQYADIPLALAYRINNVEARSAFWLYGGLSFGVLLNSNVEDAENPGEKEFIYEDIVDDFETTEFSFLFGAEYDINSKIGIGLRYTGAISKFYEDPDPQPTPSLIETVDFLRNYYLSIYAQYHF